jgi:TetR/AcrR family transcriptional repressor of lmrAB and yxaGH operons
MGRRPTDARNRLAAAAADLLRRRGYQATGVKEIAARARVPMGSLYFHFPGGKQELVLSAVTESGSAVDAALDQAISLGAGTRHAIALFVEQLATTLETSGFEAGCPLATTALELGAGDDVLASALDSWFGSWTARLAEALEAEGHTDARVLATAVVAAIEGGLVLARVARDLAPLRDVATTIDRLLAGRTEGGTGAPSTRAPARTAGRTAPTRTGDHPLRRAQG